MTLRLGDTAPDFTQDSTAGPVHFHAWAGDSWVVLFSHPADFTPVCTTELGKTAALATEFTKRRVKPIAVSVDPVDSHNRWVGDINETQNTTVNFPILADADKKVARAKTPEQAKAKAQAMQERHEADKTSFECTLMGDPALIAGAAVDIRGLAKLNGRYVILEARHDIDVGGGYATSLSMKRLREAEA